ncbi:unnamed protein product [Victoria cruziana]
MNGRSFQLMPVAANIDNNSTKELSTLSLNNGTAEYLNVEDIKGNDRDKLSRGQQLDPLTSLHGMGSYCTHICLYAVKGLTV